MRIALFLAVVGLFAVSGRVEAYGDEEKAPGEDVEVVAANGVYWIVSPTPDRPDEKPEIGLAPIMLSDGAGLGLARRF